MGGQLVAGRYLLYYWPGKLFAAPVDAAARKLTGSAVEVLGKVAPNGRRGPSAVVSNTGTLVYVEDVPARRNLAWVDRRGRETPLAAPPGRHRGRSRQGGVVPANADA